MANFNYYHGDEMRHMQLPQGSPPLFDVMCCITYYSLLPAQMSFPCNRYDCLLHFQSKKSASKLSAEDAFASSDSEEENQKDEDQGDNRYLKEPSPIFSTFLSNFFSITRKLSHFFSHNPCQILGLKYILFGRYVSGYGNHN